MGVRKDMNTSEKNIATRVLFTGFKIHVSMDLFKTAPVLRGGHGFLVE